MEATRLNQATFEIDYISYETVSFLIEKLYGRLDDKDDSGLAAIHHASEWGLLDMIQLLVSHGADPNVKDSSGQTAWEIACSQNHEPMSKYLKPTTDVQLVREQKWELAAPLRVQLCNTYIASLRYLATYADGVSESALQDFLDQKLAPDIDRIIVQQVSPADLRTVVNLLQTHVFKSVIAVIDTIAEAAYSVMKRVRETGERAAYDQQSAQDRSSADSPKDIIDKVLEFASPLNSRDPSLVTCARTALRSMCDDDLLLVLKFYETELGSRWAKMQVRLNEKVGALIIQKCPPSVWNAGVEAIREDREWSIV